MGAEWVKLFIKKTDSRYITFSGRGQYQGKGLISRMKRQPSLITSDRLSVKPVQGNLLLARGEDNRNAQTMRG